MNYQLEFKKSALKEWKKLGYTVQEQFKKKLRERLQNPHVPSAVLSGGTNIYKIKLRSMGYRLVYALNDERVTVIVVAVGKRDKNYISNLALSRLKQEP